MCEKKKHINKYSINIVIREYVEFSQHSQNVCLNEKNQTNHYAKLKALFKENSIVRH